MANSKENEIAKDTGYSKYSIRQLVKVLVCLEKNMVGMKARMPHMATGFHHSIIVKE